MNRHTVRRLQTAVLLVVLLSLAGASFGQPAPRAGFFGGLNVANQGGDMEMMGHMLAAELEAELGGAWSSEKGSATGWGFGGFYTVQTSPTFGVQIEGQYIRRGTSLDFTGLNVPDAPSTFSMEAKFQLDYLEIPVLARFSPSPGAQVRPVLLIGPVIGFKTGAKLKMSAMGQDQSTDVSEGYKSTTVGLLGGVGISALVGKTTHLTVQARYYQGLTNTIDEPTEDLSTKSGDFGLFAGMEFLVGK